MRIIYTKEYSGEEICDVERDISECWNDPEIPVDEYNIHKGTFRVTITWSDEE